MKKSIRNFCKSPEAIKFFGDFEKCVKAVDNHVFSQSMNAMLWATAANREIELARQNLQAVLAELNAAAVLPPAPNNGNRYSVLANSFQRAGGKMHAWLTFAINNIVAMLDLVRLKKNTGESFPIFITEKIRMEYLAYLKNNHYDTRNLDSSFVKHEIIVFKNPKDENLIDAVIYYHNRHFIQNRWR